MEARDEELIRTLVPHNDELRVAWEEHGRLKQRVDQLGSRAHLSPEEELEKKTLQKQKLAEKDKIMRILASYRRTSGVEPHV